MNKFLHKLTLETIFKYDQNKIELITDMHQCFLKSMIEQINES